MDNGLKQVVDSFKGALKEFLIICIVPFVGIVLSFFLGWLMHLWWDAFSLGWQFDYLGVRHWMVLFVKSVEAALHARFPALFY